MSAIDASYKSRMSTVEHATAGDDSGPFIKSDQRTGTTRRRKQTTRRLNSQRLCELDTVAQQLEIVIIAKLFRFPQAQSPPSMEAANPSHTVVADARPREAWKLIMYVRTRSSVSPRFSNGDVCQIRKRESSTIARRKEV